ncbi:MAG: hypothetical protein KDA27_01825 [Candidatus Eisenbacteria bacterium]|uniref:Uncharacterized protein n=1 Tax=Eiseniibacteriota bacterium TaxID=2212470 RepID=A0A956N8T0_UNCEI|nr:hypothetical protein [Candidatus Eisenbacteria bacterium]MCB9463158.1 hypothetical protein [Candidatus Eisenbacteria bacterium]
MIHFQSSASFVRSVSATLSVAIAIGALFAPGAMADDRKKVGNGPKHEGGVIYLSVIGDLPSGSLVGDCYSFPRIAPQDAVTEIPSDGTPKVCVVYAAFPEGTEMDLTGVTLGVEYDPSIELTGYGYCQGEGVLVGTPTWPSSGAGLAMTFIPHLTENPTPIAWFVFQASEPGEFRLVPHPIPTHGGRFANFDAIPWLEPITGYGTIRAGSPGYVPMPGDPDPIGICCVGECLQLTAFECAYHDGLFLGEGSCSVSPCADDAEKGACCLGDGCELVSRAECYRSNGAFAGEGTACESTPCDESDR